MIGDATRGERARALLDRYSPLLILAMLALALTAVVVGSALVVAPPEVTRRHVADLPAVEDGTVRKKVFLRFLEPVVRAENRRIREQRARVLELLARLESGGSLGGSEREWLAAMARRYRVSAEEPVARARALKTKVDVIPLELALAQAALESAWGTSRFAREGNNLFGQWCFEPGCGIVPERRPEGRTYEVRAFNGVGASLRSYLRNLNSHPAFEAVRRIRARARAEGKEPSGYEMAAGLTKYAAIGQRYVEHIRAVIEHNDLRQHAVGG